MLVSPAYAQSAGGAGDFGMFVPLILIFVVFYFLMIRPQQKKQKVHREMLGALRRGDRVVTNGGLIGSITRVANDSELILEIANGVKVRVLRSMVADLLSKPQPVRKRAKQEQEPDDQYEEGDYEEEEEYEDEEDEGVDEDAEGEDESEDEAEEERENARRSGGAAQNN